MHSKALLDSLDAGVAAVAPDWTIVEWSSGAAEITGLPADPRAGAHRGRPDPRGQSGRAHPARGGGPPRAAGAAAGAVGAGGAAARVGGGAARGGDGAAAVRLRRGVRG